MVGRNLKACPCQVLSINPSNVISTVTSKEGQQARADMKKMRSEASETYTSTSSEDQPRNLLMTIDQPLACEKNRALEGRSSVEGLGKGSAREGKRKERRGDEGGRERVTCRSRCHCTSTVEFRWNLAQPDEGRSGSDPFESGKLLHDWKGERVEMMEDCQSESRRMNVVEGASKGKGNNEGREGEGEKGGREERDERDEAFVRSGGVHSTRDGDVWTGGIEVKVAVT
jgi:hypothetical protein